MAKKQRPAEELAKAGLRLEKKIAELEQQLRQLKQQRKELRDKEDEARALEIIGIIEDSEISFEDAKQILSDAKADREVILRGTENESPRG